MNTFWNTQANLPLISLITLEILAQTLQTYQGRCAIVAGSACKITWKSVENWLRYQQKRVKMMTKMPRDLWERIVDSGLVAIVTVLAFLTFFVWRLLTSESDVKSHQKVQIGCFTSPSIRGISEKQSFLVYFQLGIISWKKKKKTRYWAYVDVVLIITLSILATCLVSSNCWVTHVRWGEGTSSVLFQWRPAFSALWRCGNSVVSVHHINNFWNTRSNLTKFSG